jgi:hypothetical protein
VVHPPSIRISDEAGNEQVASRLVGENDGQICQVVKYEDLRDRLNPFDLSHVLVIDRNLRAYDHWHLGLLKLN